MEWYTQVDSSTPLSQGDIILGCPILIPHSKVDYTNIEDLGNVELMVYSADVIIMTQACDLENNPPDVVIVAQINSLDETSWGVVSEINSGRRPSYHLISKHDGDNITMDYKYVDFTSIYTVPLQLLRSHAENQEHRLRLDSPYLEFMSQRFGYYFSRIGLPLNIDKEDLKNHWTSINKEI